VNPAKITAKDRIITFETAQDEIAEASGLKSNDTNLTQSERQCQAELIDLLPQIETANAISIAMDKKIKYIAMAVDGQARGDQFDNKIKACVRVKQFTTGLEWIWTKEKFLNRIVDISSYYADFKDDGKINTEKFKQYDPFFESPDTPTQIGTMSIYPKSIGYMIETKSEFKIINLKNKEAGSIEVELLPCNQQGKVVTEKDNLNVRDPEKALLNKPVSFIIKINASKNIDQIYEDMYCQFQLPTQDPNKSEVHKTQTVKGSNPNFKFSKQFNIPVVTSEFLDFILKKPLYIQVWAEQKHPTPKQNDTKITTKEFFEKDSEKNPPLVKMEHRVLIRKYFFLFFFIN
jgi:kinesin family member 1